MTFAILMRVSRVSTSLWILRCLTRLALALLLLSLAACLHERNVTSLRLLTYCQILLKVAKVIRQRSDG